MSDPLHIHLKELIIKALQLEDVTHSDIDDTEPLIGSGLSLDSIDILELVVQLEKTYGIKITNSETSREALASVSHLAQYIRKHIPADKLPS